MPSRYEMVAAFYVLNADDLLKVVRRSLHGPDAMVEDACSHAWCQLLQNDHVVLDHHGFAWLYCVALREGYRLSAKARRRPRTGPLVSDADVWEAVEQRLDHKERAELVRGMRPRRREILVLQAAGLSYTEIARATNNSVRTIDRQLRLSRAELRRLMNEASNGNRHSSEP